MICKELNALMAQRDAAREDLASAVVLMRGLLNDAPDTGEYDALTRDSMDFVSRFDYAGKRQRKERERDRKKMSDNKKVQAAVQRVRDAKEASSLNGEDYKQFLEELIADAVGWQMELDELD